MATRFEKFIHHPKFEYAILIFLLVFVTFIRGWNMFNLPYYENDEGVYMSQAWSFLQEGKLAPYTYWYDHAPAGWILIALWTVLTGGFETFGFYIHSGRLLVLLLHLMTCWMMYRITRQITKTKRVGFAAVLIYACSPLGNYFGRRILLDPLMVFWTIATFHLIIFHYQRLSILLLSAVTAGVAVLTKENAVFFIPLFLFMLYKEASKNQRIFAVVLWTSITFAIISTYPLYALLKGELFPANSFLGSGKENVSLVEAWTFQLGREGATSHEGSLLQKYVTTWIQDDPVIVIGGVLATCINILYGFANRKISYIALLSLSMIIFLLRGGVILEFYIIPLVPLFAWNIAIAINCMTRSFLKSAIIPISAGLCAVLLVQGTNFRNGLNIYSSNQTRVQREAVAWIQAHQTPQTKFIIDNFAFYPLNKNKPFADWSHWYWKLDQDRDVYNNVFNNQLENITYITMTPQVEFDAYGGNLEKTRTLLQESKPIATFWENGWGVQVRGTQYDSQILTRTYESYKRNFIQNGQIIDPQKNNLTTSEGQSYALLRAVYMNDQQTFDTVLTWTNQNLKRTDNLYAWLYENGSIKDPNSASDGDADIALALILAHQRWAHSEYLAQAQTLLNAIWEHEVTNYNNAYFFNAGNWANKPNEIVINPSYLSPVSYKIFSQIDPNHDWNAVADTSYVIINNCTTQPLGSNSPGKLPPEWCSLNKDTGEITASVEPQGTEYSFNAIRTSYRLMLDYLLTQDDRAREYLITHTFLADEWINNKKIYASYSHTGEVRETYETAVTYASALPHLILTNPAEAKQLYETQIKNKLYEDADQSYWEDPQNYYTQNLIWFTTALYSQINQ